MSRHHASGWWWYLLLTGVLFLNVPEVPTYRPVAAPIAFAEPGTVAVRDYRALDAGAQLPDLGDGDTLQAGEWLGNAWIGLFWDGADAGVEIAF